MSDAALNTDHLARHRGLATDRTAQRWAVGVLTVSTLLLVAYLALLVLATWLFASAWNVVFSQPAGSLDVLGIVAGAAPALLVGWCTGLATSAAIARGEALGARVAGLVAGFVGTTAGAAVLALTDVL
jgi:hypothetical protein